MEVTEMETIKLKGKSGRVYEFSHNHFTKYMMSIQNLRTVCSLATCVNVEILNAANQNRSKAHNALLQNAGVKRDNKEFTFLLDSCIMQFMDVLKSA
jgi:abortive infection bacteriophage resistance protein